MGLPREPGSAAPPVFWLWLLRVAAWLAPPDGREEWNRRWSSRLWNLWVLVDRGELAAHASTETALLCGDAIAAAFWMRFNRASLRRWLRGPRSVLAGGAASLVFIAAVSHGFRATRHLVLTIIDWRTDKLAPKLMKYDPRADFVVAHVVPIAMALMVGAALVLLARRSMRRCGWKYRVFLLAKLLLVAVLVPLAWIEGEGLLREHLAAGALRVALATAFTLVFFGAFGCSVIWVFADQRARCPVCLGRLALPVALGSWASVFDPATTEMICDEGHGSLCVAENDMSGEDRWIKLDASWKEL
ncbi:MAG TPA: hypothetical protein VMJ75_22840 [Candidatus Acidoferrales bacterium]|nr:hypothetical protein [Candidatus Acidoferrales bacterium]